MIASIKFMTWTVAGCLILNKFVEEESEVVSESDGNTAILIVEMWAFLSGFSCPVPTLRLLAPMLLRQAKWLTPNYWIQKELNITSAAGAVLLLQLPYSLVSR